MSEDGCALDVRGEGFRDLAELHDYWGTDTVTAAQTGPRDVIRFKLRRGEAAGV